MAKALLVSNGGRPLDVQSVLSRLGLDVECCSSCQRARALILECDYSLVIIQPPLTDGGGRDLALMASGQSGIDVVLLANASQVELLSASLGKQGVYVVSRMVGEEELCRLIGILLVSRRRIAALEEKNARLLRRLAEERRISEVKCMLALEKGMSEDESHHALEKLAMDRRISLAEAADVLRRQLDRH